MGGGSSKKEPDNQTAEKYDSNFSTFRQEREKYVKRLEILNSLPKEKIDEILESTDPSNDGIKNLYSNIFKSIDKKYTSQKTFSESEVKNGIREMMVEQALINANILTEYDIEKQIKIKSSKYIDPLLKKYGSQTFNDIFNNIFNNYYYPINQKATLSTTDPKKIFDDDLCNACYSNLKFNKKFLVDCSIFIIDNLQICDFNHCEKLSEIIACNNNLKTLILGFKSDIANKKEIKDFNKAFQSIKDNYHIKTLIVIAENSQNELKLSSDIENYIVDIVNKGNVNNLILGNFIISSNFLSNLSNAISNSFSLKTFIFYKNSKDTISKNEIDASIKKILKNKYIKIVMFGGCEITNEENAEYDKLKAQVSNIKVFECINEFKLDIN